MDAVVLKYEAAMNTIIGANGSVHRGVLLLWI